MAPFLVEYPCDILDWSNLVSAFITLSQYITLCLWVILTIAYSLWCLKIIQDLFLLKVVLVSLLQNLSYFMD